MSDNSHSDHHIINDGRDRTRSSKRVILRFLEYFKFLGPISDFWQ